VRKKECFCGYVTAMKGGHGRDVRILMVGKGRKSLSRKKEFEKEFVR
jgi:hypothetical protein